MNKIFFIRYLGGMAGEFLVHQISKDKNFHDVNVVHDSRVNRWYTEDYFQQRLGKSLRAHSIKHKEFKLDNLQFNMVMKDLMSKNIVVPSHYFFDVSKMNIPKYQVVDLMYNQDSNMDVLFNGLFWIKVLTVPADDISWINDFETNSDVVLEIIKKHIIDRNKFYYFERQMLKDQEVPQYPLNSIHISCKRYHNIKHLWSQDSVNREKGPIIKLNVHDLFTDPESNVELWRQKINMNKQLDVDVIKKYHRDNEDLFFREFNIDYRQIKREDFPLVLREYVTNKCNIGY